MDFSLLSRYEYVPYPVIPDIETHSITNAMNSIVDLHKFMQNAYSYLVTRSTMGILFDHLVINR